MKGKNISSLFKPELSKKKKEGKEGEEIAQRYFASKGYKILAQNYRTRFGEIDLICEKGQTLIFIEVRRKTGKEFGEPIESVDRRKVEKIKRVAEQFLLERGIYDKEIRFDLFCLKEGERFELIENAF